MAVRAVWSANGPLNFYTVECIKIQGESLPPGRNFSGSVRLFLAELVDDFAGCGDSDTAGEGVGDHVGHSGSFLVCGVVLPLWFLTPPP